MIFLILKFVVSCKND